MLDHKFVRDNIDLVKTAVKNKNEKADVDRFVELEQQRRDALAKVEELKHTRNVVSKEISELKRAKEAADDKIAEMRQVGDDIKALDDRVREIEDEMQTILQWIPNIPHESAPVGTDESANTVVRTWGELRAFDFEPQAHWDIGEKLDILSVMTASKISGSGFIFLKGAGARLERALINYFLETHLTRHGYREVLVPYLVTRETMFGTGQLPKLENDMYRTMEEDLFLIPTAEVPVTNIHRDEILSADQLPLKYVAFTPCFRREAGAAGKDTRGLIRVHQFNKVEMVQLVHPDQSWEAHEELTGHAEYLLQQLGLPYRVVNLSTGDLSFAAAKCYDLEVYAPGVQKWLEVSSCSNFTDFQARRTNLRYRPEPKAKPQYVHTLNGSGLALPRIVISIIENYQTAAGKIQVPKVLQPFLGGMEVIE